MALKPEVSKLTLHWDSFNRFDSRKESFLERGYVQLAEGSSCKINSQRTIGGPVDRPCTWYQLV